MSVSLLDCSYDLICDAIWHFAFIYVNQQFLRLTEVFSYLYIIHLYLAYPFRVPYTVVLLLSPAKFGPAFSTPTILCRVFQFCLFHDNDNDNEREFIQRVVINKSRAR